MYTFKHRSLCFKTKPQTVPQVGDGDGPGDGPGDSDQPLEALEGRVCRVWAVDTSLMIDIIVDNIFTDIHTLEYYTLHIMHNHIYNL